MPPSVHLAFDLGAESGRAVAGWLEDAGSEGLRLRTRVIARFANGIRQVDGRDHWDTARLRDQMILALAACAQEGIAPDSIGVDTWGVDFALLDREGNLSGIPYAYRDRRTEGAMDSFFGRMSAHELYARTGIQMMRINSVFQMEAIRRDEPTSLANASAILFMPDLFNDFLCGVRKTEFTVATTTQMVNPRSMDWDADVLRTLGLPRALLQDIVQPGTVLGRLAEGIAAMTRVARAQVVAVASHDTASAVAAVPMDGPECAYISAGTWSLVGIEAGQPVITPEALAANLTNEGGVGGTFRILRNVAGLWLLQECRRAWSGTGDVTYAELIDAAREAAPFLAVFDPDHPDFARPENMPEALAGYFARTGQRVPESRGGAVRAILESLALKSRLALERISNVTRRGIARVHVVGGGAENALLCQFIADAAGVPVVAGPVEAASIGNLLVQAMAIGAVRSLEELRGIVRRSFPTSIYEPDGARSAAWDEAYRRLLALEPR